MQARGPDAGERPGLQTRVQVELDGALVVGFGVAAVDVVGGDGYVSAEGNRVREWPGNEGEQRCNCTGV